MNNEKTEDMYKEIENSEFSVLLRVNQNNIVKRTVIAHSDKSFIIHSQYNDEDVIENAIKLGQQLIEYALEDIAANKKK